MNNENQKKIKVVFFLHGPLRHDSDKKLFEFERGILVKEACYYFFRSETDLEKWEGVTRVAQGVEYLAEDDCLNGDCELHLIPPVSGG